MGQALRLDRTRDYGTVHGELIPHGLAYEQDGLPFDHQGELIEALVDTPEKKALVERKMRKAKAKKAPAPQGAAAADAPDDDDEETSSDEDVNFDAWARGLERYEWTLLQKVARKRFNKTFSSKEQIVDFLVFDEKVLAAEDVHPSMRPKAAA